MPQYLYDREYSVNIMPKGFGLGIDIKDMRIAFNVSKTNTSEANKAEVSIYNLSSLTRSQIAEEGQTVTLKAGYKGYAGIIFKGQIIKGGVEHTKTGADIITKINCGDGIQAIKDARINRHYKAGTPKAIVLADVVKTMKDTIMGEMKAAGVVGTLTGDFSVSGASKKIMDDLSKQYKFEWSIQEGKVQILDDIIPTASKVLLSSTTGLIGTPSKTDKGVKFQSLLLHELSPGCLILMVSKFIQGSFKLLSVDISGDTHAQNWNCNCEAKAII